MFVFVCIYYVHIFSVKEYTYAKIASSIGSEK